MAIFWSLLILVACFIPGSEVPDVRVPLIDKWVHFILFGGFSFLWLCALGKPGKRAVLFGGVTALLLGYGVEVVQGSGLTEGRSFEWMDVVADGIGGVFGSVLYLVLWRFYGKDSK